MRQDYLKLGLRREIKGLTLELHILKTTLVCCIMGTVGAGVLS